jgi:hypothetical protein
MKLFLATTNPFHILWWSRILICSVNAQYLASQGNAIMRPPPPPPPRNPPAPAPVLAAAVLGAAAAVARKGHLRQARLQAVVMMKTKSPFSRPLN